jgi:hypothetical protein
VTDNKQEDAHSAPRLNFRFWPKADELDDAIGRQLPRVHRTCCNVAATADLVQAEAGDHAKFVVNGIASAYLLHAMKFKSLPAGSLSPLNRLKLQNRRSGPIGSTKSSMTFTR